ncbi:MAG: formate dehydrogenase accessory sulfurtransferase FdhD [Candidatus Bathyarchaeota archaeon]|nr:formate dehydrogenase accessory sulfurtransferase FdhD [Candidatus Bathyarchaeota archaeon]MDH5494888.1 formate dehydrogenase accessory sulfurtransferase FdhD [Candidatus Bathyarchaeota archaeon]
MSIITENVAVLKIDVANAQMKSKEDLVAREVPLHVFLGGIHFVSILCSPALLKELVVGHLLGEGLVSSVDEIVSVDFDGENRCEATLRKTDIEKHVVVSKPFAQLIVSACSGIGYRSLGELLDTIELKSLPFWQIEAKILSECVRLLNVLASTFRKTGGVHVAALFKRDGDLVALAEDVGRHNAVDKVIGVASLSQQDLSGCFLALSGRLTGDIVLKAARAGVSIVASLAGAVDSGVKVAEKTGVTLVGFVRGNGMNVYAHSERIKV